MVWDSRIFKSPHQDMGYDISDYGDVDPQYRSLQDAELLVEECHKGDIRILFDSVTNHTSSGSRSQDPPSTIQDEGGISRNPLEKGKRKSPNHWRFYFGGSE